MILTKAYTVLYFFNRAIIFSIAILIISCGVAYLFRKPKEKTKIEQSYWGATLITKGYSCGETVFSSFDEIDLQTPDSIKHIRYNQASQMLTKFKTINSDEHN